MPILTDSSLARQASMAIGIYDRGPLGMDIGTEAIALL